MNRFKQVIRSILTTLIFIQSFSPLHASKQEFEKAPLTVLSQKGKTAAGILHYALHKDEIHILLGRRDDSVNTNLGDWCNFGGASEGSFNNLSIQENKSSHKTVNLNEDAARESEEESNGIYAPHPRLLKNAPFIDVLTEKFGSPFLYRMYWQQVQYVSSDIFMEKLKDTAQSHNKEYTDFKWIKVADLFQALKGKEPVIQVENTKIGIYAPLFETLSTLSGMAFLNQLIQTKKIETTIIKTENGYKYSSIRKYRNCLYHLTSSGNSKEFYPLFLTHLPVEASKTLLKDLSDRMLKNRKMDTKFSKQDILPNEYETVPFKDTQDEEILTEAVAAHGMSMVELKRRFAQQKKISPPKKKEQIFSLQNTPSLWNDKCGESISRIHLRIVLGDDYKTPEDFKNVKNSRREADLVNIKKYFSRFTETEYDQKIIENTNKKEEFKRKISLLDSDYEFFADVLAFEEENKQWPTFYHGASENLNNLFKSFTYLKELTSLSPLDNLMALRGTDIYFKAAKTVNELLNQTGDCESQKTKNAMIFLNFVLFAGPKSTVSTSSSAEYVINNHSVTEPNLGERFEEALALAGFSTPVYTYFQSLFEQHLKYKKIPYGNSVMVAISQSPKNLDDYNYATGGGGRYYKISSTLQILHNIQKEYENLKSGSQKTEESNTYSFVPTEKRELFPENRLLLHPNRVMDSKLIKIRAFDRFPLNLTEQQDYAREMRKTTIAMLADWLVQKSTVMEGSFIEYPALKKLHKMAYEGSSGQKLEEKPCIEGFLHLVRNGHAEAVKGYIMSFPNILKNFDLNALANIVLEAQNTAQIDFFFKEIFKYKWPIFKNNNYRNQQAENPLHLASKAKHSGLVEYFIKSKAIDLHDEARTSHGNWGFPPFHQAVYDQNLSIIKIFCDHLGRDIINSTTKSECTALSIAVCSSLETLKLLLESPKIDILNKHDLLHNLSNYNNPSEKAEALLEKGYDANHSDKMFKLTPLHCAFDIDLIKVLIKWKANVNAQDFEGETPLHKAALFAHRSSFNNKIEERIKILLQNKADVNILNKRGHTPFHSAEESIKELFKEYLSPK